MKKPSLTAAKQKIAAEGPAAAPNIYWGYADKSVLQPVA